MSLVFVNNGKHDVIIEVLQACGLSDNGEYGFSISGVSSMSFFNLHFCVASGLLVNISISSTFDLDLCSMVSFFLLSPWCGFDDNHLGLIFDMHVILLNRLPLFIWPWLICTWSVVCNIS